MQRFVKELCSHKQINAVIVDAFGKDVPEDIRVLKKVDVDQFVTCEKYPNCNNLQCLHTQNWNMCPHAENCRIRPNCSALHPIEIMKLFFTYDNRFL